MKLTDALILLAVIVVGTVIGNLIVAKIVSEQASASLNSNPLLRLFSTSARQ